MEQCRRLDGRDMGTPIKALLLATAFSIFASAASAQFLAPGGYAPYGVDAGAAAAASVRTNNAIEEQDRARCRTESQGRGGQRYECEGAPAVAPKR
jgi:hypothetical protein